MNKRTNYFKILGMVETNERTHIKKTLKHSLKVQFRALMVIRTFNVILMLSYDMLVWLARLTTHNQTKQSTNNS